MWPYFQIQTLLQLQLSSLFSYPHLGTGNFYNYDNGKTRDKENEVTEDDILYCYQGVSWN